MSESDDELGASARRMATTKQQSAELLDCLSNTLAHTAQLAEQHADRLAQRDDPNEQLERARAQRAHNAARPRPHPGRFRTRGHDRRPNQLNDRDA